MIRRILHAELSDVRAKIAAIVDRHAFVDRSHDYGVIALFDALHRGVAGFGYFIDDRSADNWPSHACILTIGRVTLAAWGGRPS